MGTSQGKMHYFLILNDIQMILMLNMVWVLNYMCAYLVMHTVLLGLTLSE